MGRQNLPKAAHCPDASFNSATLVYLCNLYIFSGVYSTGDVPRVHAVAIPGGRVGSGFRSGKMASPHRRWGEAPPPHPVQS